jgi:hypothetical protein
MDDDELTVLVIADSIRSAPLLAVLFFVARKWG